MDEITAEFKTEEIKKEAENLDTPISTPEAEVLKTSSSSSWIPVLVGGVTLVFMFSMMLYLYFKTPKLLEAEFVSDPEGSQVFVDGHLMGKTPLEVSLPTGQHQVVFVYEGRAPVRKQFVLQ